MSEKIKSAKELAMEKANKMDKNNTSGGKSAELETYTKAARTLAENVAEGSTEPAKIKESLRHYPGEVMPEVTKTMLEIFSHRLNLDNTSWILRAIPYLKDDETTQQTLEEVKKIYRRYYHQREKQLQELQDKAQEKLLDSLEKEGIKGSAIYQVKAKDYHSEKQIKNNLDQEYRQNISGFRSFLESS